jgi:protoporphyrinogen oxidase
VIVGAGISGVAAGKMLLTAGKNVVVIEKKSKTGGLIRCDEVAGNLYHKVGGHAYNTKNPSVDTWFWAHFNKEDFYRINRNAQIFLQGKYINYPLENHLYQLDNQTVSTVIDELLHVQPTKEYTSFGDFLARNFGQTLYELYFKPYNEKIWQTDLQNVSLEWLDGKLPMPALKEILINNVLRLQEQQTVHSAFYYPKQNGSQFIIDTLAKGLTILLDYSLENIYQEDDIFIINKGEKNEIKAKYVIYTGDIRQLSTVFATADDACKQALSNISNLQANGTSNLLCECDVTDISWLYLPEAAIKAHRIIYTGIFSPRNNNTPTNRTTCVVEFSGRFSLEEMRAVLPLLPGNLVPLAHHYEPYSYIVQEKQTRQKITDIKANLPPTFKLLGRFAEWEYYNMDKCIESAMAVVNTIVSK